MRFSMEIEKAKGGSYLCSLLEIRCFRTPLKMVELVLFYLLRNL